MTRIAIKIRIEYIIAYQRGYNMLHARKKKKKKEEEAY